MTDQGDLPATQTNTLEHKEMNMWGQDKALQAYYLEIQQNRYRLNNQN